jgi:hypothetical protein
MNFYGQWWLFDNLVFVFVCVSERIQAIGLSELVPPPASGMTTAAYYRNGDTRLHFQREVTDTGRFYYNIFIHIYLIDISSE